MLTSDMSEFESAHAAQLAATQQRLQSLTEQLAAQQLNSLQQQQQQQPGQLVASSLNPTDPPSPVLKARTAPQRPKSAAAAATVRPLTTAAAAGPSRPGSRAPKPSWVVPGSAALVRQECVKDSLYAGALMDSNAGKDIRLAVDGSSSGGGSGGSGSGWGCRPSTALGIRGAHVGSSCSDGSSEEAALLLRLRQQVGRQVTSELQQKAAVLLHVYTATPAAVGADATAAAAAAATAETAPAAAVGAAGKPETSAAVAAGGQSSDALLLAGLAVTLQAEVSRCNRVLLHGWLQGSSEVVVVVVACA